jgi:hypothetical protein
MIIYKIKKEKNKLWVGIVIVAFMLGVFLTTFISSNPQTAVNPQVYQK